MKTNKPSRNSSGFTLTEMLVVIAIIGVIAAILLPALANAKRRAHRIKCVSNLSQIYKGLAGFADDNRQRLPWQLTPRGLVYHFGAANPYCTDAIFSLQALKGEFASPQILASPCHPEAQAPNELARKSWEAYSTKNGKTISCEALSYSLIQGADLARPSTMLASTKNLTTADLASARWAGADEPVLNEKAFAGLYKNQGQAVFADGSARQANDSDIGADGQVVKAHQNSHGGISKGPASTAVLNCCGGGNDWNFEFGYTHVYASHANKYVAQISNAKKYPASPSHRITYWGPKKDGQPGVVTQTFKFPGPIRAVLVRVGFMLLNHRGSKGSATVWASKDKRSWEQIADFPSRNRTKTIPTEEINLPYNLLGANTIHIQVRMMAVNSSSSAHSPVRFAWDTEVANGKRRGTSNVFFVKVRHD